MLKWGRSVISIFRRIWFYSSRQYRLCQSRTRKILPRLWFGFRYNMGDDCAQYPSMLQLHIEAKNRWNSHFNGCRRYNVWSQWKRNGIQIPEKLEDERGRVLGILYIPNMGVYCICRWRISNTVPTAEKSCFGSRWCAIVYAWWGYIKRRKANWKGQYPQCLWDKIWILLLSWWKRTNRIISCVADWVRLLL